MTTRTAKPADTVAVLMLDGVRHEAVEAYSSGPGCRIHTYRLRGGAWLERGVVTWRLHAQGDFPRVVTLDVA